MIAARRWERRRGRSFNSERFVYAPAVTRRVRCRRAVAGVARMPLFKLLGRIELAVHS